MRKIRVIVCGALGRMGQEVISLVQSGEDMALSAAVDRGGGDGIFSSIDAFSGEADVVVDFSHHSAIAEILSYCKGKKLPVIVATTGHTEGELSLVEQAGEEIPVFQSANMSLGVALLAKLVKQAAAVLRGCDVEIIEKHHNRKLDAPSGTALVLAEAVKSQRPDSVYVCGRGGMRKREANEIGIHSLRLGNVVGEHEVIFSMDSQSISLKHEAHDRSLFAEGAIAAAHFMVGKPAGLYRMEDLVGQ